MRRTVLLALCAALLLMAALSSQAWAGTTGAIRGRALDTNGQPIADASVSATSPSQNATAQTNSGGYFNFLSLAPDTYVVTVSKSGYNPNSVEGITVISDQTRNVSVVLELYVKTLSTVRVRASNSLVRPGTTSDVYSINAAAQKVATPLAGSGGLNQAYGAIASAPGVVYQQGQQGWYQNIYIRGGDVDQTAYEVDGVPVMRVSDSATVGTLSSLGNAEVQVYTGGTPASTDASGIAGYVNQVIKVGTYPGYASLDLGIGGPALYNTGTLELGGATPDRRFTYYLGYSASQQDYRYGDQFNAASNPLFFYPLVIPSNNGTVFDGSGTPLFAPGQSYAISNTLDREAIGNIHIGIPHKYDSGKDDIQILYVDSELLQRFYSSIDDLGLNNPAALAAVGFPGGITYFDGFAYNGPVFQPPNPMLGSVVLFPNSPQNRTGFGDLIPTNEREGSQNGSSIFKLQWQRNIDAKSYLRIFGYGFYSTWYISGPVSAQLLFGAQLPDYEVIGHTWGGDIIYSRQLSDRHLLNVTTSYMTSKLQTYSAGFSTGPGNPACGGGPCFWEPQTSLIDAAGNCYNPFSGFRTSCFDTTSQGTITGITGGVSQGLTPAVPPPGTPAALNNAQWIVTENGQNAQVDNVTPYFTGFSVADQWRPSDRLTVNIGLRYEDFRYRLQNLETGYPARAFWFNAFNNEFCFGPGQIAPSQRTFDALGNESACPPGTAPTNLQNYAGGTSDDPVIQPRLGFTYQMGPDTVLRASYGRYARSAPTSYKEFNTFQQDLPTFISQFINLGFNTPHQNIVPDTSNNFDLSLEHHFPNTQTALKLTPFYRSTQGQIQYLALNAQGVLDGLNIGRQRSYGFEFDLTQGDFAKDGFAYQAAFTYTHSRVQYGPFPNGLNIIDLLNQFIQKYNGYTSACAGATTALCTSTGVAPTTSAPCFDTSGNPLTVCAPGDIGNPYFSSAPQPLMDRNGQYTTYDLIPAPFDGANGFETPIQASLILNWKRGKFNISPSFTYTQGTTYGSPLVWPGYDPATCTGTISGTQADTTTCGGFIFIPDKYTGVFDNLGSFTEPSRMTANLSLGYELSSRVSLNFTLTNLVDTCWQRGYPWDSPTTCTYAQLASNLLAPAGNFVTNPPVQLAFPYGNWYNNTEVGQEGQKIPTEAVFDVQYKL